MATTDDNDNADYYNRYYPASIMTMLELLHIIDAYYLYYYNNRRTRQ